MTTGSEERLFERSEALLSSPMRDLASIAALAYEYAVKAELGEASSIDLSTLSCHCKVLADDLYELAKPSPKGMKDGYPFGELDPDNAIDQAIVKEWNRVQTPKCTRCGHTPVIHYRNGTAECLMPGCGCTAYGKSTP